MTAVFDIGVTTGLEKVAARDRDTTKRDAAMVGGGGLLMAGGRHRLLGTKRVYHGTTADRWQEIRRHGLDPAFGGTGAASHAAKSQMFGDLTGKHFQQSSKGKVHVTSSRPVATAFSRFSSQTTGKKPKVVAMNMDYDKFKRMEIDPDMVTKGTMPEFMRRHLATRGTEKIGPEEIKGSAVGLGTKAKRRLSKLPDYVRRHPGRFGLGVLGTGLGAYLAQKGARRLVARYRGKGKKND